MQSQRQTSSASPNPAFAATSKPAADLFQAYNGGAGNGYDELQTNIEPTRVAWNQFRQLVGRLGTAEFSRRWNHSQRLIYENGLAYSPYGNPDESGRPWELDPLPLILASAEWEQVAEGVAQRAQVLELTLRDLLGPQRLIKEGVLPGDLLFGHPHFRLPFLEQNLADQSYLQFYASDLARAPDGRWWVLTDRTESPSGIGFALENRIVVSRMLPDIFRQCRVKRLAPFFQTYRNALQKLAASHVDNPRVVLLSRGPQDENYFEDAYLARYLGHTLIESSDLAIRENRVWLKTLDGLLPVDVISRRPNSELCDPLEFGGNTLMGVAGLLNACRGGSVSIVNPLGSGLVESPVVMAFMPRLCKFFLDTDLQLPGLATWWCGEEKSLQYVLNNLDRLIVGPAFRSRGRTPETSENPNTEQLREQIQQNPTHYVAQERLEASVTPVWSGDQAVAREVIVRAFAVRSDDAFTVFDGGLARTSEPNAESSRAVPRGQGSKDAWIVSGEPVEPITLMSQHDESISLRRTGTELPSRLADNVFWLGRQIERADAAARLLRTFVLCITSETSDATSAVLRPLLRALAEQGQIEPGYAVEDIKRLLPDIESNLPRLVFDTNQPGSLRSILDHVFRLASQVRDRISVDTWRVFVRIDQQFRLKQPVSVELADLLAMLNALVIDLAAIAGMVTGGMTRTHIFRFLDLGARLEQAMQVVGLVRSCFANKHVPAPELLEAILEIGDSLMTYRSRYLANLQMVAVLDLLLTDETNPRSIAFQLHRLEEHVEQLPLERKQPGVHPHRRLVMSMIHILRMVDIQELCELHCLGEHEQLDRLLDTFDRELPMLSNEISRRYLVHAGAVRKMSTTPIVP